MIFTPTTGPTSPDELTRAAQRRLNNVYHANIRELTCECDERGVLYLRGRLRSYYQKQLAQEAVSDLPGIVEIENQAEVVCGVVASPTLV